MSCTYGTEWENLTEESDKSEREKADRQKEREGEADRQTETGKENTSKLS